MKYPGVQKLIDVLKVVDNSPTSQMGFDMYYWYGMRQSSDHPCGTACCIAGWAQASLIQQGSTDVYEEPLNALIKFCDLPDCFKLPTSRLIKENRELIWELTAPERLSLGTLTPPMAIRVLEIFRDTGEVQWNEVYNEMKGD